MTEKTLTASRPISEKNKIIGFILLASIVLIVPFFIHNQWLIGPLINAILIFTAIAIGPAQAITIGLLPSTVALAGGLLPLILAPMVPFIMLSNAIYILLFEKIYKKTPFSLGIIIASSAKAGFLYATIVFLMPKLIDNEILLKVGVMFTWPQLISALIGGFIAFIALRISKKI